MAESLFLPRGFPVWRSSGVVETLDEATEVVWSTLIPPGTMYKMPVERPVLPGVHGPTEFVIFASPVDAGALWEMVRMFGETVPRCRPEEAVCPI